MLSLESQQRMCDLPCELYWSQPASLGGLQWSMLLWSSLGSLAIFAGTALACLEHLWQSLHCLAIPDDTPYVMELEPIELSMGVRLWSWDILSHLSTSGGMECAYACSLSCYVLSLKS